MHSSDLMQLALFVADHAPRLWQTTNHHIPEKALQGYWTASRIQIDHWVHLLRSFSPGTPADGRAYPYRQQLAGLLEEIVTGEVLARLWTAALSLYDGHRGQDQAAPIARSVFLSHLEVRMRVLHLLNDRQSLPEHDVRKLVQLGARNDRWSDLLLAWLAGFGDLAFLAVDATRFEEFQVDFSQLSSPQRKAQTWDLMRGSFLAAYASPVFRYHPQVEATTLVAGQILACYPPEALETCRSSFFYQEARLVARCRHAQELLEDIAVQAAT